MDDRAESVGPPSAGGTATSPQALNTGTAGTSRAGTGRAGTGRAGIGTGRSSSGLGVLLVVAAAAVFSVNGTISKSAMVGGLSSLQLVEIRCAAATLVFAAVAAARAPASLRVSWRELGQIAVYGVIGVAMVQWLYYVSIERMPVSIALLIEFTAPVMIALWVRFGRREPVHNRVWVALALILVGLALVARVWGGLTLDGLGVVAAVLAAVSLALYYLLGENALGKRDSWAVAAWSFGAAALFWSLVAPWWHFPWARLGEPAPVGHLGHTPMWVLVSYVVLLGTVLPFSLVLKGISLIGAARVGLLSTLEPPLAGIVAWFVMGEQLSPVQLLGGAVVLAGVVIAETARAPRPTLAPPAAEGLTP